MLNGEGDFGNARGLREARENRDAIDRRARIEAMDASATRRRLEKGLSSGERTNLLGKVAAMATVDALAGRSVEGTLGALRNMAQGGMRKARAERPKEDRRQMPQTSVNVTPIVEGRTYERVKDAAGRMRGGMSTDDGSGGNWPTGEVLGTEDVLSVEAGAGLCAAGGKVLFERWR